MKILFAGENPGGSANYYLGVFNHMKARVTHVPSSRILRPSDISKSHDAVIFSDFPRRNLPPASERMIADRAARGVGLMMIGGWGSFSGPFGGWRGSRIEKLLPVRCASRDDRVNFSQGAYPVVRNDHPMIAGNDWNRPPMFCGLNRFTPAEHSITLLEARPVDARMGGREDETLRLSTRSAAPLLVASEKPFRRAALATDLAPHWCGGLVDWGARRIKLRVDSRIQVEVSAGYVRFISGMVRWLAGVG